MLQRRGRQRLPQQLGRVFPAIRRPPDRHSNVGIGIGLGVVRNEVETNVAVTSRTTALVKYVRCPVKRINDIGMGLDGVYLKKTSNNAGFAISTSSNSFLSLNIYLKRCSKHRLSNLKKLSFYFVLLISQNLMQRASCLSRKDSIYKKSETVVLFKKLRTDERL